MGYYCTKYLTYLEGWDECFVSEIIPLKHYVIYELSDDSMTSSLSSIVELLYISMSHGAQGVLESEFLLFVFQVCRVGRDFLDNQSEYILTAWMNEDIDQDYNEHHLQLATFQNTIFHHQA